MANKMVADAIVDTLQAEHGADAGPAAMHLSAHLIEFAAFQRDSKRDPDGPPREEEEETAIEIAAALKTIAGKRLPIPAKTVDRAKDVLAEASPPKDPTDR